jgi:hypothetical protein
MLPAVATSKATNASLKPPAVASTVTLVIANIEPVVTRIPRFSGSITCIPYPLKSEELTNIALLGEFVDFRKNALHTSV